MYGLMKKLFFFAIVVATTWSFVACTSEIYVNGNRESTLHETESECGETAALIAFNASLDSLNNVYADSIIATRRTFGNYLMSVAADAAGQHAGGAIGSWIGAGLGGAFGNPVTAVGGYVGGRFLGQYVGAALASYLAERYLPGGSFVSPNGGGVLIDGGMGTAWGAGSFGITHNNAMQDIFNHRLGIDADSLGSQTETWDAPTLAMLVAEAENSYDICVESLKGQGIDGDSLYNDPEFKSHVISFALKSAELARQCYDGQITRDELFDKEAVLLRENCGVAEDEIVAYTTYGKDIALACGGLTVPQLKNYATDLNAVIQAAPVSDSVKAQVAGVADIIVNSTICWTVEE